MSNQHNSTQVHKKSRIQKVFEMLVELTPTVKVVQYCIDEFGVTKHTGMRYILEANNLMNEYTAGKREDAMKKALLQREFLIDKLIESKNYAMASQALMDKSKLEGLYTHPKDETTVNIKLVQK